MTSKSLSLGLLSPLTLAMLAGTALAQDAGWPRTITHQAGELTLDAQPLRIVSTTPSVTGTLLAIGAPVAATAAATVTVLTDDKGFFIQWAEAADERGVDILYPNLEFDLEAVLAWEPDLLIVSATGGDSVVDHYAELQAQGIPTMVVNYSDRTWQELATELGAATGLEDGAQDAIARFDAYAEQVAQTITPPEGTVSVVGFNIGGTYSIGKTTSPQARLLGALGFDVVGLPQALATDPGAARASDFEFISLENLSAAIEGETVFLLRGTEETAEAFRAEPVLANVPAVTSGQVYPLGISSFRIDYYSGLALIDSVAALFR